DEGTIIPVPAGYEAPDSIHGVLEQIKQLEFEQQITLFRDLVGCWGVDPSEVEHDSETGL
ncbi:MAG TPA: orange carotenoid protein N-terminal domain-containing protein, partial [Thermosynechococcaceae cyanobacterium]